MHHHGDHIIGKQSSYIANQAQKEHLGITAGSQMIDADGAILGWPQNIGQPSLFETHM